MTKTISGERSAETGPTRAVASRGARRAALAPVRRWTILDVNQCGIAGIGERRADIGFSDLIVN